MQQVDDKHTEQDGTVKVWDLFVRFFHWSLVLGFTTAFLSGEFHYSTVHTLVGYALSVLIAVRLYWGFRGSRYARFASFFFSVSETREYLRSMLKGHPRHYYGHNPAGALMVFALLATVTALLATGLATLAVIDYEGPLLFLANRVTDETSYAVRHLHEFIPDVALVLVGLHLLGVVSGSIQHRENLVRAMITGRKVVPAHTNEQQEGH